MRRALNESVCQSVRSSSAPLQLQGEAEQAMQRRRDKRMGGGGLGARPFVCCNDERRRLCRRRRLLLSSLVFSSLPLPSLPFFPPFFEPPSQTSCVPTVFSKTSPTERLVARTRECPPRAVVTGARFCHRS